MYRLSTLCCISLLPLASVAGTFTFNIDNDGIFGTDKDYSNGLLFSYYSDSFTIENPHLIASSLGTFTTPHSHKWGISLAQKMWTPSELEEKDPLPNERPYAGFLYAQVDFANIGSHRVDRFATLIGTTGENSYAEQSQNFVHNIIGSTIPEGWEHQIDNQFILNTEFETHHVFLRQPIWGQQQEIQNVSRIMLGNYRSEVATGFIYRWGQNLADNVGVSRTAYEDPINPGLIEGNNSSYYFFTGAELRYRFNDITIEGDAPDSVYPVTLENVQGTVNAGAVWYNSSYGVSATFSVKSSDFKEDTNDLYGIGSLSLFAFY